MTGDRAPMQAALGLAGRALGRVAPNPAVGCILYRDDRVVGRGWTRPGGRPHAETEALRQAGDAARGATAYVTLEPCAHHGKTGPCADALVAAGICRAVVAVEDPDPRVSGRGIARLRAAGIAVETGILAAEAEALNFGFFKRIRTGLPLVTLKLASSLDGRIATRSGQSKWITGERARQAGHLLRHRHDAILVGSGTVLADDPLLDVRLPGFEALPGPIRIVADRRLRIPADARLVKGARDQPTLIATVADHPASRLARYAELGVEILPIGDGDGRDLYTLLHRLGSRGVTRLLVEGGGTLAAALLRAKLVDRIAWFRSAGIVGGDGLAAVAGLGVDELAQQVAGRRLALTLLAEDVLETWAATP